MNLKKFKYWRSLPMDGYLCGEEEVFMLHPIYVTANPADAAKLLLRQPVQGPLSECHCHLARTVEGMVPHSPRREKPALQSSGSTVFVSSFSQHGEKQHYSCSCIQNTDTHEWWKKWTLSQLKPVQHPRRQGVKYCSLLKMGEARNSLKNFLCLPYLLLPTNYQDAQLTLENYVPYL